MSTIDEQFVEFVVKSLVNNPDDVQIDRTIDKLGVLIKLTVNPEDLGRVIGKRGATAQSIRTLLRALGTKNEARYNLKIIDNGEPRPDREERREEPAAPAAAAPTAKEEVKEEAKEKTPKKKTPKVEEKTEAPVEPEPVEKPLPEPAEEAKEEEPAEEEESLADKTMKELDDLDDLEL